VKVQAKPEFGGAQQVSHLEQRQLYKTESEQTLEGSPDPH